MDCLPFFLLRYYVERDTYVFIYGCYRIYKKLNEIVGFHGVESLGLLTMGIQINEFKSWWYNIFQINFQVGIKNS